MSSQVKKILSDSITTKPTGHLEIQVFGVQGGKRLLLRTLDLGNLVVNNFTIQELIALCGIGLANRVIAYIEFGTNGAAEDPGDVAITPPGGGPVTVPVSSYSYPYENQVRFEGTLDSATGNGETFQECGLKFLNTSPALAARKTFPNMDKSDMFEWVIRWTLTL